jgi:hypothetical protein
MRKYLLGGLITIAILGLFSYTTTDNGNTEALEREVYNIPLKQKKVVTTENINYVNKLVGSGYVLQFVTERQWGTGDSHTRYTLVKY